MNRDPPESRRVLVAEERQSVRSFLVSQLLSAGFQLTEVADGASAIRVLRQEKVDIALVDVQLPGRDGLEVLKEARKLSKRIPILMITDIRQVNTAIEVLKLDADDYLTLPLSSDTLIRAVAKGLQNGTFKETVQWQPEIEARLRQSQKLEAIGRLTSGVAHDLNNLMTVMMGHSEMLLECLQPSDPLRVGLEEIRKVAERATSLARQLLTFSRKEKFVAVPIDLNTVVAEMEKMLKRLMGPEIELVTRLDPNLHRVRVNPSQMEQVLMNLALNARDAMPRGGRLTIETGNVSSLEGAEHLSTEAAAARGAKLVVRDTGLGMDEETLSHVFEPFFTTKAQGRGTGLGLAIVREIVQHCGGEVRVSSQLGQGTAFTVVLPHADSGPSSTEEAAIVQLAPARGGESVLLVEDEDSVRTVLREILRRSGYQVIVAADAKEAIKTSERLSTPVQLLLTDLAMPHMNGRQLAAHIRRDRPEMRILYVSGHLESAALKEELEKEGAGFLPKPFLPDALLRAVREVLDKAS